MKTIKPPERPRGRLIQDGSSWEYEMPWDEEMTEEQKVKFQTLHGRKWRRFMLEELGMKRKKI
jgi:hypothetical protein